MTSMAVNSMSNSQYKANITAGSLLVPESRKIARLLLEYPDRKTWKEAIESKNILQQRSPSSAVRIAGLIKARMELMTPDLWMLVAEGDSTVSTHAVFAVAIKHCRLMGDFLDIVVREQFRRYETNLPYRLWDDFIDGCKQRDYGIVEFPSSTAIKVRNNIYKILHEVGYLKKRRTLELQFVHIAQEVVEYLKENNELYVLKCIQI